MSEYSHSEVHLAISIRIFSAQVPLTCKALPRVSSTRIIATWAKLYSALHCNTALTKIQRETNVCQCGVGDPRHGTMQC